jgi:hypothetical protein
MELDVIAICCDYSEDRYTDLIDMYSIEIDESENDDEIIEQVKNYMEENTSVIGITDNNRIVYRQF